MLRMTWTYGRRSAVIGASAAVVCLGAVLVACGSGSGGDDGYVAVGAAGGTTPRAAAEPTGSIRVVPLDGADAAEKDGSSPTAASRSPAADAPAISGPSGTPNGPGPSAEGAKPGRTPASSPAAGSSAPATSAPADPVAPAALTVGEPEREATDQRWCEKVTLAFRNSGGTAVRSGTVTFGTHIIGALGVDWGTVESVVELPVPIGAGVRKERTWTVCVEAWRVPLGMHIETRDVDVRWK